jgi:hypothetical protein
MIDTYINIEKVHKEFDQHLKDVGVNKLVLKNVQSPKQVKLVVTSLSKYGDTKKNLSDLESSNKPFPTLIIVNDDEFSQTGGFSSKPTNRASFKQ